MDINTKKRKNIFLIAISIVVMLLAVFAGSWFLWLRTVPKMSELTVELGEPVSLVTEDYLTGIPLVHKKYSVDLSSVNNFAVGDYVAVVSNRKKVFEFSVHIVDTTAPLVKTLGTSEGTEGAVNLNSGVAYSETDGAILLELAEEYDIPGIVGEIYDASMRYTAELYFNGETLADYVTFPTEQFHNFTMREIGYYDCTLMVMDESGNVTTVELAVEVVDTTPPEIILPEEFSYYATAREYSVSDFITGLYDASGEVLCIFFMEGKPVDTISMETIGLYNISLCATDKNGNETVAEIEINFDDAPRFVGNREEVYVARKSKYDPLETIRAFDNEEGNISDRITLTSEELDCNKEGTYTLEYSVTDLHGLTTSYECHVIVGKEDTTAYALTTEEVQLLIDNDYFVYDPLAEENFDEAVALVEPSCVNLLNRKSDVSYNFGSGFIYKVDSDYIYIASVYHVIKNYGKKNLEMRFFDDEETIIIRSFDHYERANANSELAMFRLPISDIPADILLDVMQIYADESIYSNLSVNQKVVAYSGHWKNQTPTVRKMTVLSLDDEFDSGAKHCIVTTHNTKGGMSGCPVFDYSGSLVGLCEGYWKRFNQETGKYDVTGYSQRIDGIFELYQRLVGLTPTE